MFESNRVKGLIVALIGFGFAAFDWDYTVTQARAHAAEVSVSSTIILLVAIGVMGIVMMIAGAKINDYSKKLKNRKKNFKDIILLCLIGLPGVGVYYMLQNKVESYGYDFSNHTAPGPVEDTTESK